MIEDFPPHLATNIFFCKRGILLNQNCYEVIVPITTMCGRQKLQMKRPPGKDLFLSRCKMLQKLGHDRHAKLRAFMMFAQCGPVALARISSQFTPNYP